MPLGTALRVIAAPSSWTLESASRGLRTTWRAPAAIQSTWSRDTTRHVRICPRAGLQVNQHQPRLHAISRIQAWLGIPDDVDCWEPFTAERWWVSTLGDEVIEKRQTGCIVIVHPGRNLCRPTSAGTLARRQR